MKTIRHCSGVSAILVQSTNVMALSYFSWSQVKCHHGRV